MLLYSEFDVCSRSKAIDWCSPQLFHLFFPEGMMGGAEAESYTDQSVGLGIDLNPELWGFWLCDLGLVTSLGHSCLICQKPKNTLGG